MGSSSWPQVIRKAVCAFKTEITTEALPWKKIKHTCQRQVNTFPHESYLTQAWRRSWLLPISLNKTENKSVCITCGLITFSTFSPWSQMTFRLMGNLGQLGVSEGWYSVNLAQLFERFCLFWSSLLFCVCFFFSLLCILIHLQNQLKHYICKRQKISDISTCTSWVAIFFVCSMHLHLRSYILISPWWTVWGITAVHQELTTWCPFLQLFKCVRFGNFSFIKLALQVVSEGSFANASKNTRTFFFHFIFVLWKIFLSICFDFFRPLLINDARHWFAFVATVSKIHAIDRNVFSYYLLLSLTCSKKLQTTPHLFSFLMKAVIHAITFFINSPLCFLCVFLLKVLLEAENCNYLFKHEITFIQTIYKPTQVIWIQGLKIKKIF